MSEYRLHWTKYVAEKAKRSGNEGRYYQSLNLNWSQKGDLLNYLNSVEYNHPEDEPPKMDRTAFYVKSLTKHWIIYRKKSSC
ncbi:hypothetical protein [Mucilaginibacter sp.]|uniref:hypothetical protein n=1 Tax=Mucilaginibacter sp. TaxID=1882438 RepID=UPI003262E6E9